MNIREAVERALDGFTIESGGISEFNFAVDLVCVEVGKEIADLEAERDALRTDAQRYEWLREPDIWEDSAVYVRMANGNILAMSDLDNYIDAAIAAKGAQS